MKVLKGRVLFKTTCQKRSLREEWWVIAINMKIARPIWMDLFALEPHGQEFTPLEKRVEVGEA